MTEWDKTNLCGIALTSSIDQRLQDTLHSHFLNAQFVKQIIP